MQNNPRAYTVLTLSVFIITALMLCGCAKKQRAPNDVSKVVSLSPALTETVFQLGKGNMLVGRSDACDYPAEAKNIAVAGRFADPNTEAVLSIRPDILITNDLINPQVRNAFENAGIRVVMKQTRTMEDYAEWVKILGRELNAGHEAKIELERIKNTICMTSQLSKDAPNAIWVIWDKPLMLAGRGSLPHEVMTRAGLRNISPETGGEYFKASSEFIITAGADFIIWTAPVRDLTDDPIFGKLEAVKKGRVITFSNESGILRPGPRIFDGIRELKEKVSECQKK